MLSIRFCFLGGSVGGGFIITQFFGAHPSGLFESELIVMICGSGDAMVEMVIAFLEGASGKSVEFSTSGE